MPLSPAPFASPTDAVCRDSAQMALHMQQCTLARGRWFGLRSGMQRATAATAGRLVTVACAAALLAVVLAVFI